MNERIRELLNQSMVEVQGHGAFGELERYKELDPEKFAELIVRECAEFTSDFLMKYEGSDRGVSFEMKKRFGVE